MSAKGLRDSWKRPSSAKDPKLLLHSCLNRPKVMAVP
ncbi:hypothetical protein FOMG_19872 [Fusarium oxysporum f. sp. melonis 26406]|uniref:Uncharacterized protein n=1 Tax=Fusarium oxysporum f. sp. melonis 26406 TaxID=1089452 RepID=W9Z3Y2_FUSOX|nr:hypothetical protein FOMG_19872 [Fusarium oxysporum f. sp. melonis 26406]